MSETSDLFPPITRAGSSIVPPPSWPRARNDDPATSHASAASVQTFAGDHHRRILYALQKGGAGSIHDLAYRCVGLSDHAIGKRLVELERAGLIRQTGETKAGPNGRTARVWAAIA